MYVLRDKLQDCKRKPQAAPTHREVQRLHEKNAALVAEVANLKRKLEAVTRLLEAESQHQPHDGSPVKRHRRCTGLMAL